MPNGEEPPFFLWVSSADGSELLRQGDGQMTLIDTPAECATCRIDPLPDARGDQSPLVETACTREDPSVANPPQLVIARAEASRGIAVIGTLSDQPRLGLPIELPDTVIADIPFAVVVRTIGGGCERIGPTELSVDEVTASVVPYDYTPAPGRSVICDAVLKIFEHDVTIVFQASGSATVTVRARDDSGEVQDHVRDVWVR